MSNYSVDPKYRLTLHRQIHNPSSLSPEEYDENGDYTGPDGIKIPIEDAEHLADPEGRIAKAVQRQNQPMKIVNSDGPRSAWGNIVEAVKRGNDDIGDAVYQSTRMFGNENAKLNRQYNEAQESGDPLFNDNDSFLTKSYLSVARMAPAMAFSIGLGALGGVGAGIATGVGAAAGLAGTTTATSAAGTLGSASYWFVQGAGDSYNDMVDDGVDPRIAFPLAAATGALYAAVEQFQMKSIPGVGNIMRGTTSKFAQKIANAIPDFLANTAERALPNAAGKFLKKKLIPGTIRFAGGVFNESAEEGLQQFIMDNMRELGVDLNNQLMGTDLQKAPELANKLGRAIDAFLDSLGPMAMISAIGLAGRAGMSKALASQRNKAEFKQAVEDMKAGHLDERAAKAAELGDRERREEEAQNSEPENIDVTNVPEADEDVAPVPVMQNQSASDAAPVEQEVGITLPDAPEATEESIPVIDDGSAERLADSPAPPEPEADPNHAKLAESLRSFNRNYREAESDSSQKRVTIARKIASGIELDRDEKKKIDQLWNEVAAAEVAPETEKEQHRAAVSELKKETGLSAKEVNIIRADVRAAIKETEVDYQVSGRKDETKKEPQENGSDLEKKLGSGKTASERAWTLLELPDGEHNVSGVSFSKKGSAFTVNGNVVSARTLLFNHIGKAMRGNKEEASTVPEQKAENPYLKMPVEQVRKHAIQGVKLAQQALAEMEQGKPEAPQTEEKPQSAEISRDNGIQPEKEEAEYEKRFGNILNTDNAKLLFPGYDPHDRKSVVEYHKKAGPLVGKLFQSYLKNRKGKGNGFVVFTAGGNGSGKSSIMADDAVKNADFIMDSTMVNLDAARNSIQQVIDNNQTPVMYFAYRNPADAWFNGVMKRNRSAEGHIVPETTFANTHSKSKENFIALAREFGDKVKYIIRDNSHNGNPEISLDELDAKPKYTKEQILEAIHAETHERARKILEGFVGGRTAAVGESGGERPAGRSERGEKEVSGSDAVSAGTARQVPGGEVAQETGAKPLFGDDSHAIYRYRDFDVYNAMPDGWGVVQNANSAPRGFVIISNNKSRFATGRVSALIREERIFDGDAEQYKKDHDGKSPAEIADAKDSFLKQHLENKDKPPREITSSTYERARKRMDKSVEGFLTGRNTPAGSDITSRKTADTNGRQRTATDGNGQNLPEYDNEADDAKQAPKKNAIEDFGEKLDGARKDYVHLLEKGDNLDAAVEPLSKLIPVPDYDALVQNGMKLEVVSAIRVLRDHIGTKPKNEWKLKRYVKQLQAVRQIFQKAFDGSMDDKVDELKKLLDLSYGLREEFDLYNKIGHQYNLKGYRVSLGSYSFFEGKEYHPAIPKYSVSIAQKAGFSRDLFFADSREQALSKLKDHLESQTSQKKDAENKSTSFDIYQYRSGQKKDQIWIGKKISSRKTIDLVQVNSAKEAREYIQSHQDELEQKLKDAKYVPATRGDANRARIGQDYRNGQDVTPEMFQDAFGFRGVQFGNWVGKTDERQQNLNEAYDALHDLAKLMNVSTRALSLNGELGLAFGARGKGGVQSAAAHYEPDTVVINLTRMNGAGSLAHEWFHALDHYFATRDGKNNDRYASQLGNIENVRDEMKQAFQKLVSSILYETKMVERGESLDETRSKPYWGTRIEVMARAFESYVKDRIEQSGDTNDFLANISDINAFANALLAGKTAEEAYPYPLENEKANVRKAFDGFIAELKEKEGADGKRILYSAYGNSFSYFSGSFNDFMKSIRLGAKNIMLKRMIAPVSNNILKYLSNHGINVDHGFNHVMDNFAVFHVMKEHGNQRSEEKRGQIAITSADIAKADEIINHFDKIGVNKKHGEPAVIYAKRFPDGTTIYLEEVRTGRKELALKTMYKMKGDIPNDLMQILEDAGNLNAHNDSDLSPSNDIIHDQNENVKRFSENSSGKKTTMPERIHARKIIMEMKEEFGADAIETVNSVGDLPDNLQSQIRKSGLIPEGFFDPATGKTWFVLENLKPERAAAVFLHENIGHKGFESFIGKDYNRFIDRLWLMRSGDIRRHVKKHGYPFDFKNTRDRRDAVEEFIAALAEQPPTVVQKVIHFVRQFLRNQFKSLRAVSLSDSEIKGMLDGIGNEIKQGKLADPKMNDESNAVRMSGLADTESEAFKKWFGDSKVVDKDGKPLVVDGLYLNLPYNPVNPRRWDWMKKLLAEVKEEEKKIPYKYGNTNFFYQASQPVLDKLDALDVDEGYIFDMLYAGREPQYRVAFRYGEIRDNGKSYNYRDNYFERGVSVVGRVADLNTQKNGFYESLWGDTNEYFVVGGWDLGFRGADGEILLADAKVFGKNVGKIAKSAEQNSGAYNPRSKNILLSAARKDDEKKENIIGNVIDSVKQSFFVKSGKIDFNEFDTRVRQPFYLAKKVAQFGRVVNAAFRSRDVKVETLNYIHDSEGAKDTEYVADFFKRHRKDGVADKLSQYLWQRDRDAIGARAEERADGSFRIIGPDGMTDNTAPQFPDGHSAWAYVYNLESKEMKDAGFDDESIECVRRLRDILGRSYDVFSRSTIGSLEKWCDDNQLNFKEVVKPDIFNELRRMGDRRGYYMPRQRHGEFALFANKPGEAKRLETFDNRVSRAKRVYELQKDGYNVECRNLKFADKASEDVLLKANELLQNALEQAESNREGANAIAAAVANQLASEIAESLRETGAASHKIGRDPAVGSAVVRGYDEDVVSAIMTYTGSIAGSHAKNEFAQASARAIAGTDVSFDDFCRDEKRVDPATGTDDGKEANPEALRKFHAEYIDFCRKRRLDAKEQKNAFHAAMEYREAMLRNNDSLDRMFGFVSGLAAIKYLSRPSSAIINVSAMITNVPATMMHKAGCSAMTANRSVARNASSYLQWRRGNGTTEDNRIYDTINRLGWDREQFSREAVEIGTTFASRGYRKFSEIAMFLFSATERFNRAVTIKSAYDVLKNKEEFSAIKDVNERTEAVLLKAKEISDQAHGVYGKENNLLWMNGAGVAKNVFRSYGMFKTFMLNTYGNLFDMIGEKHYASAAYLLAAPMVLGGIGASLIPTEWISDIVRLIWSAAGGEPPEDPEEALYDGIAELFGAPAGRFSRTGLAGLAGINIKGSLSPDLEMPKSIKDLGGAPWSFVSDMMDAVNELRKGDVLRAAEKSAPGMISAPIRAYREATRGVTDRNNRNIFYGNEKLKPDFIDTVFRIAGANPASISEKTEKQWSERKISANLADERKDLYAEFRRIVSNGNTDDLYHFIERTAAFNRRVARSGISDASPITAKSLLNVAKRNETPSRRESLRGSGTSERKERARISPAMRRILERKAEREKKHSRFIEKQTYGR